MGNGYTGVLSELLDHPAVAGILAELLAEPPFRNDPDAHPFRCEDSFTTMRRGGFEPVGTTMPHGVRPPQLASGVSYRAEGGQIFGGLIRVCWELAPVERGEGGTVSAAAPFCVCFRSLKDPRLHVQSFLSGSHKAHFLYGGPDRWAANVGGSPWEESIREAMEDYACPAGSVYVQSLRVSESLPLQMTAEECAQGSVH